MARNCQKLQGFVWPLKNLMANFIKMDQLMKNEDECVWKIGGVIVRIPKSRSTYIYTCIKKFRMAKENEVHLPLLPNVKDIEVKPIGSLEPTFILQSKQQKMRKAWALI